jgi:RNA polymerase primary sigma factor
LPAQREQLLSTYRRGISLKGLAAKIGCARSKLYLPLLEERVARLKRKKIKFIDDELYHGPDAARIMAAIAAPIAPISSTSPLDMRVPRDLPPYLQALYRTALLTPQQERTFFLKFNFHKFQFVTARRRLDPQFARVRDLQQLEGYLADATKVKNQIVQANLRLVVSVARKHLRPGLSLMELISDGNITLMRAVEGFDVHRGHRFSTYATLALMKGFARSVPLMQAAMACGLRACGDHRLLQSVPDSRLSVYGAQRDIREQITSLLSELDPQERVVLNAHYGLEPGPDAGATFKQLAKQLGVSKHRVRHIEQVALAKLRARAIQAPSV